MILKYIYLPFVGALVFSCNNTPNQKNIEEKTFFPLASFLNDQWKSIDSFHFPVTKIQFLNGIADTSISSLEELKKSAEELVTPDITLPASGKEYTESKFADQSIPSITITYSAKNKSLPVQRLDILLEPNPDSNDKLRNIYMEKNEGSQSKKILLRAERSLQVITTTKDSTLSIVKFAWDGLR